MRTISKNIGQLGYDEEVRNSLNDAAIELPLVNSGFTFQGDHDPTISEYPAAPTIGDVWVIIGVTGSYTFTTGDLIGRDVVNGNQIVYGTSWSILNYNEIPLSEYNSNKALWQNQAVTHNITVDADYTLTTAQNTYGRIIITDTGVLLTGSTNIIVNTIERSFIAQNDTAQTLTFKTSAGTGVAIAAGKSASVLCDATNVIIVDSNYAYSKAESDAAILADALERRKLYAKETTTHEITSDLDYTLTSAQNLYGRIVITDTVVTLTGTINIIVDTTEREFIAVNSTAQILTFKTSAGTGIAVGVGKVAILQCDGTNVIVNDTNYAYSKLENNALPTEYKNSIINGSMAISQEGISFTPAVGVETYTLDQWISYATGAATTITQTTGTGDFKYSLNIDGIASNTTSNIITRIEGYECYKYSINNGYYSLKLYSSEATTVDIVFSSADVIDTFSAITVRQTESSISLAIGWNDIEVPVALNSNYANGMQININFGSILSGQNRRVTGVMLEKSSVKTSFPDEYYSTTLLRCQRYTPYYGGNTVAFYRHGRGEAISTTVATVTLPAKNNSRINVNQILYSGNFRLLGGATSYAVTGISLSAASVQGGDISVDVTVSSGLTAGQTYILTNNSDTSAYLLATARL